VTLICEFGAPYRLMMEKNGGLPLFVLEMMYSQKLRTASSVKGSASLVMIDFA
jgi:hypothetical protein